MVSGASDALYSLASTEGDEFSNIEDPTITTNIQDELYSNVRSTSDAPVAVAKCSPLNISSSTSHPSETTFHEGMGIDRDPKGHLDTVESNRAQLEKLQSCVENEIRGNPIPIFDLINTSLTAHSRTSIAPNFANTLDITPTVLNDITTPNISKSSISSEILSEPETENLSESESTERILLDAGYAITEIKDMMTLKRKDEEGRQVTFEKNKPKTHVFAQGKVYTYDKLDIKTML